MNDPIATAHVWLSTLGPDGGGFGAAPGIIRALLARVATLEVSIRDLNLPKCATLVKAADELSKVWGTEDEGLLYAKAGAVVAAVDDLVEP